jgi:hypothetical protein
MAIGEEQCEFYDKIEDLTGTFDANSFVGLPCDVPSTSSGLYDVSQVNKPVGKAKRLLSVPIYHHVFNKVYDFAIVPMISQINSNKGSPYGQRLTIRGSGFSDVKSENVVKFGQYSCAVKSASSTRIVCDLETAANPSNPTAVSASRGWHSGFRWEWFSGRQSFANLPASPTWTKSRLDGETNINLADNYVTRLRGWFQAPTTGPYKFFAAGDDKVEFWISMDGTLAGLTKKAWTTSATAYKFYWDANNANQVSDAIQLTAGQEYLVEVLHSEGYGADHSSVGVLVPGYQSDVNNVYQVQKVQLQCPTDNLIIQYTIKGDQGTYKLCWDVAVGEESVAKCTINIPWDATEAQIESALSTLGATTKATKVAIPKGNGKTHYQINVEFKSRLTSINGVYLTCSVAITGSSGSGCIGVSMVQMASLAPSGTFKITRGTKSKTIAWNEDASSFAEKLRQIGYNILIRNQRFGDVNNGAEWRFAFVGDREAPFVNFDIDYSNLKGCKNLAKVQSLTVQEWSNTAGVFYEVIPFHLLKSYATKAQITVTTNGMLANCPKFTTGYLCDYEYVASTNVPVITSNSFNEATSTLTVTLTGASTYLKSSVTVSFAFVDCTVLTWVTGATSTLTARCNNPQGGDHYAKPNFANVGNPGRAANVQPIHIGSEIVSADPSSINPNGGNILTIQGTGFPNDLDCATESNFQVTIGGSNCQLLSVSSSEITCETGPEDDEPVLNLVQNNNVAVTYTTISYIISNPAISDVSPKNFNPVLETEVTVSGALFSTDITQIAVKFINRDNGNQYDCLVKSIVSSPSEQIICVFFGAPTGEYNVQVNTLTNGASNVYEKVIVGVSITSVSPQFGSTVGGTILTIGGGIFSGELKQTLVYIGNEVDWVLCDVLSSTASQVTCQTRVRDDDHGENVQPVTIATRIVEESLCPVAGNCQFTYHDDYTPTITDVSPRPANPGDIVTLTGTKFSATGNQVKLGSIFPALISQSETTITFRVPADFQPNPATPLTLYVPNLGWANFISQDPTLEIPLTLASISATTGPTSGLLLTITGNGFHSGTTVKIGTVNGGTPCQVRALLSPTQLRCKATVSGEVKVFDSNFPTGVGCTTPASCTLTLNNAGIPSVTGINNKAVASGAAGSFSIQPVGSALGTVGGSARLYLSGDSSVYFESSSVTVNTPNTQLTVAFTNVPAGSYDLELLVGTSYATVAINNQVTVPMTVNAITVTESSYNGGKTINFVGTGFFGSNLKDRNKVSICGLDSYIVDSTPTQITFDTPAFFTPEMVELFGYFTKQVTLSGTWTSDKGVAQHSKIYDGSESTYYVSNQQACYIQLQLPTDTRAELREVSYFPQFNTNSASLAGSIIQGSDTGLDGSWTNLYTLTASTHDGWNTWYAPASTHVYKYFRFYGGSSSKKCALAEISFKGYMMSTDNTADDILNKNSVSGGVHCAAVININGVSTTKTDAVWYRVARTPAFSVMTPNKGTTAGGTTVTLEGLRFENDKPNTIVTFDGIPCAIQTLTSGAGTNTLTCITGAAGDVTERTDYLNSFTMMRSPNGYALNVNKLVYRYVDYWSKRTTWGGIVPPRAGDSAYIPPGQTVIFDMNVVNLQALVIEGALVFEDQTFSMNLNCKYIMINGGKLQIGTPSTPLTSDVVITLQGTKLDPALPYFGNKVLGIRKGVLDIHGKPYSRTTSWLTATLDADEYSIKLPHLVDWENLGRIVITSTDHSTTQTEEFGIATIAKNVAQGTTTITLNRATTYSHYAGTQTIDGKTVEFRAEVAYLSRKIRILGDSTSEANQYGAQVMAFSPADETTIIRISHTEIAYCGQAYDLGRYAVHVRGLGNVRKSFLRYNSIHHSYNRGITVSGVNYLPVQGNTLYNIMGHAVMLETGAEFYNLFEDNWVIDVHSSSSLLNTDQTPACFFITNPNNIFRRNRCAGSERYGFWFALKTYPDGLSCTTSICPKGERLGEFTDNHAHSCGKDGLRVSDYIPRESPCGTFADYTQADAYATNPEVPATFSGFIGWKNGRDGINVGQIGAVTFDNTIVADNIRAGIEVSVGNKAPFKSWGVTNAWIAGVTENSGDINLYTASQVRGLVTPRTDWFWGQNIHFSKFTVTSSVAIETCSGCEFASTTDSGARTSFFEGISYEDVTQRIRQNVPYRDILRDTDGTLLQQSPAGPGWATVYYPHLDNAACHDDAIYGGYVCNNDVVLRRIVAYNYAPKSFYGMDLRILQLTENIDIENTPVTSYSKITFRDYSNPQNHWAFVAITGTTYKIHWGQGLDWEQFRFARGDTFTTSDLSVILHHNHTQYRETYESRLNKIDGTVQLLGNQSAWNEDLVETFNSGDWYHDYEISLLKFVLNGHVNGTVDLKSFRCRDNCPVPVGPAPVGSGGYDGVVRKWCGNTVWPNGVPEYNDDVIIPPTWTVILDCSPPCLRSLTIHGRLIWDTDAQTPINNPDGITLCSQTIWVQGELTAGSATTPYPYKAKIRLWGDRDSHELTMNQFSASNKVLGVTGTLSLFGEPAELLWSHLREDVAVGATEIKTIDSALNIWKAGDHVLITPSNENAREAEVRVIQSVEADKIVLTAGVSHKHHGAFSGKTTDFVDRPLDYRGKVIWLNRTIVVEATREDNWGGRIYATEIFVSPSTWHKGQILMDSVHMDFLGQGNTTQAGLTFERITSAAGRLSSVSRSVMTDSEGWNALFYKAKGISITDNTFWHSKQRGVVFENEIDDFTFTGNFIFGNLDRGLNLETVSTDLYDATVALMGIDAEWGDGADISGNIIGACDDTCIAAAAGDRALNANGPWTLRDNVAHSGAVGFYFSSSDYTSGNLGVSHFTGWGLQEGIVGYSKSSEVLVKHVVLADVRRGFVINTGLLTTDALVTIQEAHVYGIAQTHIAGAYTGKSAVCSDNTAIYIPVHTEDAKPFPPKRSDRPWERVRSNHLWKGSLNVENVHFENFQDSVNANCLRNTILRSNEFAADASSITSFSDITKTNVGANNLFKFANANPAWINLVDCGGWQCTGLKNILVRDVDGSLNGPGPAKTMFPDNTLVADGTCTLSTTMNGYTCAGANWGMLTFQSEDNDKKTRIVSPITVQTNDGFKNELNSYMDHETDEITEESALERLSRWHSIVKTNKNNYEILYTGTVPNGVKFQLQGAAPTDWVVVKQRYTRPQVVQLVNVGASSILQGPVKPSIPSVGITNSDGCGANIYFGVDQTVQFKLTGASDCVLKTEVTNAIKGSMRYDINIDDFFSQDGPTKFIDRIVMVLGLSATRIRVVNIVPGSTVINFHVIGQNQNAANTENGAEVQTELKGLVAQLNSAVADGQLSILNAAVLDSEFEISVKEENLDEAEEAVQSSSPIMIIIIAGAVSALIVLIGAFFVYRRYQNLKSKISPNIATLAGKYNFAKASSQAELFSQTMNDIKIEDAEPNQMKSISDITSPHGETSKMILFSNKKLGRSVIWDREDPIKSNVTSDDI